jgi:imidazolonepropionase-like amidohydrolase/Tol biopolymer transport system component
MFRKILLCTAALSIATGAVAQNKTEDAEDAKWDVTNPPGEKRSIKIDVTEGTWMSLDVSPDGKTLAFDMLGDIYTVPTTGGTAKNIASGFAWEFQPRFSPDGSRLAFTSDRAGGDNIWTMAVDGSDMQQVTDESFRLLNNPTWHPSGDFIAARKHYTTSRSAGVGEIWLYSTEGGSGVQLVERPSEAHQKELGEPMFTPDGKGLYYSQNITPGPIFEYAQDSNTELFQIKRYDMETGETDVAAGGAGGAVRPTPSPDGKYLAYVKRVRAESKLFLKDIESGEERMIFDHLDQDMQETWAITGVYPNMDWSPDSESIYFWAKGKIHRYDVAADNVEHIEFRVKDTRDVLDAPRSDTAVSPDSFKVNMPRFAEISPDGTTLVYESLGKIYTREMASGAVTRLTSLSDDIRELQPSWSRDGQSVAFVSWDDAELGAVHMVSLASRGVTTVTTEPGHYREPHLSPDGRHIVYQKRGGGNLVAPEWSADTGLYIKPVSGGDAVRIAKSGGSAHFDGDNDRLFYTRSSGGESELVSVDLSGNQERVHLSNKMAQAFVVSPDGRHVAFRENYNLYVTPLLPGPQKVGTGRSSKALPVTKVSEGGATYPSWTADGKLYWTLGPKLFSVSMDTMKADDFEPVVSGVDFSTMAKADKPTGTIALINARIVTMKNDEGGVIENGTIVIEGDRILRAANNARIPSGAKIIDLGGKTVTPGFIDAHAHGPQGVAGLVPQQNWETVATLALGVTTVFDPSSSAELIFPAAEMQRAGKLLAPRIFSTGEVIYGAKAPGFYASIESYDDAAEHVDRLAAQGALAVKNYNQPRRDQRQQVVEAARKADILVVAEGGSQYHMDMALVQDGNTSVEHNLPTLEIYDDVIQMYSQTNVAYTPTLAVTYGGVRGEDYYYQTTDVWKHPILSRHVPPTILQARSVRRQMAPIEDYSDAASGAVSKRLMEAGVPVSIGAHGQREGLAAHWEMQSFQRGGMSPLQALMTATTEPARHLGLSRDLGTIEAGKLADLVIMEKDPLADIANAESLTHVMIGGRLYESATMNEVETGTKARLPYWWE